MSVIQEEPISEVQLEIAFLSCLTRNRPIGKEKHTVILWLQNEIYLRTRVRLDLADLWGRLEGMYDLQGIDNLNRSLLSPPPNSSTHANYSTSQLYVGLPPERIPSLNRRPTIGAKSNRSSHLSVDTTSTTDDTLDDSPLTTASTLDTDITPTVPSTSSRSPSLLYSDITHSDQKRARAGSATSAYDTDIAGTTSAVTASATSTAVDIDSERGAVGERLASKGKARSWVSGRSRGRMSVDDIGSVKSGSRDDGQLGVSVEPLKKKRKSQ